MSRIYLLITLGIQRFKNTPQRKFVLVTSCLKILKATESTGTYDLPCQCYDQSKPGCVSSNVGQKVAWFGRPMAWSNHTRQFAPIKHQPHTLKTYTYFHSATYLEENKVNFSIAECWGGGGGGKSRHRHRHSH